MSTDFNYGGKQIVIGGPIKPNGKDMPSDARTRVDCYADIATIPNPYVGLRITVKVDETNNNKMTDYIVKSLKANSIGLANSLIDEVVRYVDYLGINGQSVDTNNFATKEELGLKADKTELHSHINKTVLDGIASTNVDNWNNKVDKVEGKTLTTNDYTNEEKQTVASLKATVGDTSSGLVKDVKDLKTNGVSQDNINVAIENYLTEHPVSGGATAEQAAQIEANRVAIGDENSGLTKEVNDIKNTELQNLNTAILRVNETVGNKSELPVGDENIIASINRIDGKTTTGNGLTSEQAQQLQTAYEHSQSDHVTMDEVNAAISNAQLGGEEVDTTPFATDLSLTGSNLQLKNSQGNLIGNAITLPSTSGGTSETVTVVRDIYANNEMPKMYVTSDRLGSLTKKADGEADCEVEIRFNRQIIKCYATGKVQGNSSESLPAKNYTFKFYSDAAHATKNKIDVGWGKQSKYCFKKNYVDSTHTRNLSGARIAYDMVNSRPESDFKTNLLTAPRNGAVDGFPCVMYLNGDFWGLYTWNIPKDAWTFNMKDNNPNHMVLCAEYNNNHDMNATNTCQFRALWGGKDDANWSIEVGTYSEALKTSFNNAINFVMTASDEDFKANISNHFDLYSLLDYYCFSYLVYHYDGLGKNVLMATYDGIHWGACLYDMDSIYGATFNGQEFLEYNKPCPENYQENNSLLWQRIERCFAQELYDRYVELRKGALSLGNIVEHVEEIYDLIPDRVFKEDWTKWSGIPSQATNTLTRFRAFMKNRAVYVDSEFEAFDTTPKPVSGVLLDQYAITANQNSPITLTATVKPNSAINKNVTWSCDDETVQLTPSGLTCEVNCPNLGTPRVTVTTEEGGFTASCVITVVEEGTAVTDGLVRYIDFALDSETAATKPTTIKDKVDDSITYTISGASLLYNQQNITKDGVGWKESGLRGKQYSGAKIGIETFQYQMPEQFTIECCQSFDNGTSGLKILSIRNSFNDMIFQVNTTGDKIQIQNGLKTINAPYTFESNKLYHITITYDGANARLLINGVEVIKSQAYAKAGDSTTFYVKPFGISDGKNTEGTIEGLMCYFKIYNKVLTDNEIAANYAIESANRVMDR